MTETNGDSETIMNAAELVVLVREAVLEGVAGKRHEAKDVPPDATLIVGQSVRSVIAASVSDVVRDLVGKQILLSGPLTEIATKAHEAYAEIEGLWSELRKIESTLAGEVEKPVSESEPDVTDVTLTRPAAPDEVTQHVATVVEPVPNHAASEVTVVPVVPQVEPPAVSHDQAPPVAEKRAVAEVVSVEIPGWAEPIVLTKKTSNELKSFFSEFVEVIVANGAIQPRSAMSLARKHGYTGTVNSLRDWLDNHLYTMRKFKDAEGESWWGLPKQGEKPAKRDPAL